MKRRSFLKSSVGAAMASSIPGLTIGSRGAERLEVHIFSKHLQFLEYEEMAKRAAEIGFDGVELTVRPKGHVEPANVQEDLPHAIRMIRSAGLKANMVASDVNNLTTEHNATVLQALADSGVETYRMRYYRYPKTGDPLKSVQTFKDQAEALVSFNKENGLSAVYQNHAGPYFGSSMWEIRQMCEGFNADHIGCQYDIRHATVEGGLSWQKEIRVIMPYMNAIVAKDFLWKEVDGKWKVVNVPLGEGHVDWLTYFRILKEHKIHVPVSLHLEYPIAGAEHGDRDLDEGERQVVYDAMKRDLAKLHELWAEA